jgi:hypothetical protein
VTSEMTRVFVCEILLLINHTFEKLVVEIAFFLVFTLKSKIKGLTFFLVEGIILGIFLKHLIHSKMRKILDDYAKLFKHTLSRSHVQALPALFGWSIPDNLEYDNRTGDITAASIF